MESRNLINAVGLSSIFSQFDRTSAFSRKYSSFRGCKRSNCCVIWAHWKAINTTNCDYQSALKNERKQQIGSLHDCTVHWHRMPWLFVRQAKNLWRTPAFQKMVSNDTPTAVSAIRPMSFAAISFDRLMEVQ